MAARRLVTGDDQLDRALAEFEPKLANKMLRRSLRKGGKIVQAAAKRNLAENDSIESGALQRGIRVRAFRDAVKTGLSKTLRTGQVVNVKKARIGVQIFTSVAMHEDPKFGGAQVEFGRRRRRPYKQKPFLRPAGYQNEPYIRQLVKDDVNSQISATKANNIR